MGREFGERERNVDARAESSAVVRAYRRTLSPSVRHRIDRRVPLGLRFVVKRAIGAGGRFIPTPRRAQSALAIGIHPSFYRGAGRVVAHDGARSVAAWAGTAQTPLEARRRNFVAVTDALDEAGIDYFCVRGLSDTATAVAVVADDWSRVTSVIGRLVASTSGYVSSGYGDETRKRQEPKPGHRDSVVKRTRGASVVRVTWFRTDTTGRALFGERYGCEVEQWDRRDDGALAARRHNRVTPVVAAGSPAVLATDSLFTRLAPADREPLPDVRTVVEFTEPRPDDVAFPIDVVITWVDGGDPAWVAKRADVLHTPYHAEAANDSRYRNRDELRYALRSIRMYAPWVRKIFLVTDGQRPSWMVGITPGLEIVDHRDIFTDPGVLPTFNSHAIETQLHHIDGLSEHFLYFNDDMMLGCDVTPQTFFYANGLSKYFLSKVNEPWGEPGPTDVPVTIAGKNNRRVLRQDFGTSLTQKMKHVPYSLRRSVLAEIEARYPAEIRATMASRTRGTDDISLLSSFYQHYAFSTGRAVPGSIDYIYVDLVKSTARRSLGLLLARRDVEAFCLNSTRAGKDEVSDAEMREFLDSYFPIASQFERDECARDGAPPDPRRVSGRRG
jgi:hypothetical protein